VWGWHPRVRWSDPDVAFRSGEVLTESHCVLAPTKLVKFVERPGT
jgi:hypothetical protein